MKHIKNVHIQKVCEIMRTPSPVHQYKVSVYAEALREIEQETARKGGGQA